MRSISQGGNNAGARSGSSCNCGSSCAPRVTKPAAGKLTGMEDSSSRERSSTAREEAVTARTRFRLTSGYEATLGGRTTDNKTTANVGKVLAQSKKRKDE